jgi:predicted SAM-dependent methyltransferase
MRSCGELWRDHGLLGLTERAWTRAFEWLASWRLSHVLGRLRNLWRLPVLRRRHRGGKLNLGCGRDPRPGFLNADLGLSGEVHMDVTRRFPFADGSFRLVFTEHLLEHLSEAGALRCLHECHRVLEAGGILRVSTPDLTREAAKYLDPAGEGLAPRPLAAESSPWKYPSGTMPSAAQALNDGFYLWEHRHLYDREDLTRVLRAAGFEQITFHPPGAGSTELTTGLESRIGDSLVAEATR